MSIQPIDVDTLNLSGLAKGVLASITDIDDYKYLARGLSTLPIPLQGRMARKYIDRYNGKKAGSKYKANEWMRRTIKRLKPRFGVLFRIAQSMPFPWHILSSVEKTKGHARLVATEAMQLMIDLADSNTELSYRELLIETHIALKAFAKPLGVRVPFSNTKYSKLPDVLLQSTLLKLKCDKWWARKLKLVRRQYLELLEISTGQVGKDLFYNPRTKKNSRKGISPYSSKLAQQEYIQSEKSGLEFLKLMELEGSDGTVIDLVEAAKSGMANPKNRRNELMLRIRETEELADEMGYVGVFLTLTAPSRYHANSQKWSGTTPKDAQSYLNRTWSRARSKLNRRGLDYFGVRVAEPHADGTPHWHMMLFMPKKKMQEIIAILRWYFIQENKQELYERRADRPRQFKLYKQKRKEWGLKKKLGKKAKEPSKFYKTFNPRFEAVLIDKSKGSAASYIAKYISKNIDGYMLLDHQDAETDEGFAEFDEKGKVKKNNINPVRAWASVWGIRQFQFLGSPSVTVYRELRRLRNECDDQNIEPIRYAANEGHWKDYVKLQGGMSVGKDANFKPLYEYTEFGNDYGEVVQRIKGVLHAASDSSIVTRLVEWTRQLKGTAEKNARADSTPVGAADYSWTSGNNCTPCSTGHSDELVLDMQGCSENEIRDIKNDLLAGKRIMRNGYIYLIRGGQLLILDKKAQVNSLKQDYIKHVAHSLAQKEAEQQRYEAQESAIADWDVLNEDQIDQIKRTGHVVAGRRVYYIVGNKLNSFKRIELNDMERVTTPAAQDVHWQKAREIVDLAFTYAQLEERTIPSNTIYGHNRKLGKGLDLIGDLELAQLAVEGQASAISDNDWWGIGMMA
ncbi:replication endonuclease [Pseudoalteromonas luteoviolacea]|uniref:Replication protein n=1 Tax=Pseudoalteromonas luteoviolacea S4060-1 TaxID=1365257 RepID=A0A162BFA1_9GAMM|nr:replication endonuclease [Pseudoalteromonas luteoviolacea]KZN61197.1 replication protein [Pseudoalteromonas luteoviolacea S4060-1]